MRRVCALVTMHRLKHATTNQHRTTSRSCCIASPNHQPIATQHTTPTPHSATTPQRQQQPVAQPSNAPNTTVPDHCTPPRLSLATTSPHPTPPQLLTTTSPHTTPLLAEVSHNHPTLSPHLWVSDDGHRPPANGHRPLSSVGPLPEQLLGNHVQHSPLEGASLAVPLRDGVQGGRKAGGEEERGGVKGLVIRGMACCSIAV